MSSLRRLPPELREMIFAPAVANWNGKTPALLIALRPNSELYHEALELFYRQNHFILQEENNFSFGEVSQNALNRIEKVEAILTSWFDKDRLIDVFSCKRTSECLQNLREVKITFDTIYPGLDTSGEVHIFSAYGVVLKHLELLLHRKVKTRQEEILEIEKTKFMYALWVWKSD